MRHYRCSKRTKLGVSLLCLRSNRRQMALSAKPKSVLANAYLWLTICAGALVYVVAAYRLDKGLVDHQFALIAVLTIFLSSRITIRIPQFGSQISVSDTFVFLTLLLYGYEAAILISASEALLSSFRFCKRYSTILFNWGCAALSTCATSYALSFLFGDVISLRATPLSPRFVGAIAVMAMIQYATNSG